MLKAVGRVEAVDRYTVKVHIEEPFAWFLDALANPMAVAIRRPRVRREVRRSQEAEAVVGRPWMLESYRPNAGLTLVRNPSYFVSGLPHIDRVELAVDEDNASRMSAFLAGKYDLGWEFPGNDQRTDWIQIKDTLKRVRPQLRTAEFSSNVETHISHRTRSHARPSTTSALRQAISLAIDRQGMIDATQEGVGIFNPAVPAAAEGVVAAHRSARARAPDTSSTTRRRARRLLPAPVSGRASPGASASRRTAPRSSRTTPSSS